MKKNCFLLTLLIISFVTQAQEKEKEKDKGAYQPSFTAKFAPAGLAIGKITFGGEYNFRHKQSLTLLVGVPFDKSRSIDYNGKTSTVVSTVTSVMAGYRYYLGKKDMSGIYFEPYAKYVKMELRGPLNGDLNGHPASFDSRFNYEGFGAGLQLGVQFLIARKMAIDLFLIGAEANSAKFSSASTDKYDNSMAWSLADAQAAEKDIKNKLKDIPVVGDKIDVRVDKNAKTVYTSFSGFAPGFRAGASIGFRF